MTSSSNNILHNCLNETPSVPLPVSTNMVVVSSPASSIRKALSSNDSFGDFEQVENKKKQKRKRKPAPSVHSQANVISAPVIPPLMLPVAGAPLLQNLVQQGHASQHMHHPHQISITNESTRYGQTRYPFPSFINRFNTGKVTPNHVKEGLIERCNKEHQLELNILNCRLSSSGSINQYDILLFLKDVFSFSFLLDQNHWPNVFNKEPFTFPTFPSIPPQLSLSVKTSIYI